MEAKKKQFEKEEKLQIEKSALWDEAVGLKTYPRNKNWFVNEFNEMKQNVSFFGHILFFKEENAKYDYATFAVLKISLNLILWIIQMVLYVLFICFIVAIAYPIKKWNLSFIVLFLCGALFSILFARIIRIVKFEIRNIQDRDYLLSMLSAVTSFVAMILALVSIIKP